MADQELMTAAEVAEMLRVSVWLVWRWTREGVLPSIQLGRNYRFRRSEVERWVTAGARKVTGRIVADPQPAA